MQFGNFKLVFLFFFFTSIVSAQTLEDQIYDAVDAFVANPSKSALTVLNSKENNLSKQVKSWDEKLALVILNCN